MIKRGKKNMVKIEMEVTLSIFNVLALPMLTVVLS